ncbi:hypothetical protein FBUS_10220, partial [Fasciolopsis buskii]
AGLTFAKRPSGDISGDRGTVVAAAEILGQCELGELALLVSSAVPTTDLLPSSTVYNNLTWSRNAVASGATKRACVVTYSGTEDSSAEATETMTPNQQPQSNVCILPGVTSSIVTSVGTLSPSGTTASGAAVPQSTGISTGTVIPQQYMATHVLRFGATGPNAYLRGSTKSCDLLDVFGSTTLPASGDPDCLSKCPRRIYHVPNGCQSLWIKHFNCHLTHSYLEARATGNHPFCRSQYYEHLSEYPNRYAIRERQSSRERSDLSILSTEYGDQFSRNVSLEWPIRTTGNCYHCPRRQWRNVSQRDAYLSWICGDPTPGRAKHDTVLSNLCGSDADTFTLTGISMPL